MSEARPFTPRSYQTFLEEGKLMGSRCTSCGALYLPPRSLCPCCGGRNMEWRELRGRGEIRAYTVIHAPPTSMVGRAPYTLGLVKLDEGPMLTARISDGEESQVGTKVIAEFKKEEDRTVLIFKPI